MSSESVATVRLYLVVEEDSAFYLEIPLDAIRALCSSHRKYLLYLAWCILGVQGSLNRLHAQGQYRRIPNIGDLVEDERYYFIPSNRARFAVVDLEVIKTRTGVPSETTGSHTRFRTQLLRRDSRCVWTGNDERYGKAVHIIPYRRASDRLSLIVENRPSNSPENEEGLEDINDVRNGFFAFSPIHVAFESRDLVILKTPNRILDTVDIPPRFDRQISDDVLYPHGIRYTLQWLVPDTSIESIIPNNSDATFKKHSRARRPSELLLDYNYGAAAVKLWGRGTEVLQDFTEPQRPPAPVSPLAGPSKTKYDRKITIKKREKAKKAKERADRAKKGKAKQSKSNAAGEESHAQVWDEDDVMLFFWGNSRAAQERYIKRSEDKRKDMEQWRQSIKSMD